MNRAAKINLLTSIVQGSLTAGQVAALKKSREPIYLTLNLDDGKPVPHDPTQPTYHIHVSYGEAGPPGGQTTATRFWHYPDGRIEYVNK